MKRGNGVVGEGVRDREEEEEEEAGKRNMMKMHGSALGIIFAGFLTLELLHCRVSAGHSMHHVKSTQKWRDA